MSKIIFHLHADQLTQFIHTPHQAGAVVQR